MSLFPCWKLNRMRTLRWYSIFLTLFNLVHMGSEDMFSRFWPRKWFFNALSQSLILTSNCPILAIESASKVLSPGIAVLRLRKYREGDLLICSRSCVDPNGSHFWFSSFLYSWISLKGSHFLSASLFLYLTSIPDVWIYKK